MPAERLALTLLLALGAGAARAADAPPAAAPLPAEDAELFEFLGEFGEEGFVDPFAVDAVAAEDEAAAARKARDPKDHKRPAAPAAEPAPERRPEKDHG
jgi:hypothetical protein